jgi:hypothetical protein
VLRSYRIGLATLAACAVITGALPVSAASADPFQDQWAGNIQLNYTGPDGIQHPGLQRFSQNPPASLGTIFSTAWASVTAADPRTGVSPICSNLQTEVSQQLTALGYGMASWNSCSIPATGDLQAALTAPGQVELHFLVPGNSIAFDVAAFSDPTVDASFNLEIDVTLAVDATIDGADQYTTATPVSLVSAVVRFSSADVSSSNILLNTEDPSFATKADQTLDQLVVPLGSMGPNLDAEVMTANQQLHTAAQQISAAAFLPGTAADTQGANEFFELAITVDPDNLNFNLSRAGVPPAAPIGCTYSAPPSNSPLQGNVSAICAAQQPAGVTALTLQMSDGNGGWMAFIGDADDTLTAGSWAVQTASGQPQLDGVPPTDSPVEIRVCSFNEWGSNCAAPATVTPSGPPPASGGPVGSPLCGPDSHPYQPCYTFEIGPTEIPTVQSPLSPLSP